MQALNEMIFFIIIQEIFQIINLHCSILFQCFAPHLILLLILIVLTKPVKLQGSSFFYSTGEVLGFMQVGRVLFYLLKKTTVG